MLSPYNLQRFLDAQENSYNVAKGEIISGKKQSHWMWYIFPQLAELGHSSNSKYYGILSLDEVKAYLAHPLLASRIVELSQILLTQDNIDIQEIFGNVDSQKLKSSMTLFELADPANIFGAVLDRFFHGKRDRKTLDIVKRDNRTK